MLDMVGFSPTFGSTVFFTEIEMKELFFIILYFEEFFDMSVWKSLRFYYGLGCVLLFFKD